jgi:hypothetical protein
MHSKFNFIKMTAEEIHIKKLKELGYKDEPIKELVSLFYRQQKYLFAEDIHKEKLKLLGISGVSNSLPINEIIGLNEPYSLRDILLKLVEASNILMHEKNYDGTGWEFISKTTELANEKIALLSNDC